MVDANLVAAGVPQIEDKQENLEKIQAAIQLFQKRYPRSIIDNPEVERAGKYQNIVLPVKAHDMDMAREMQQYFDECLFQQGFRPEKDGCFVATVCCGTPNHLEAQMLRAFRDRLLLKTRFGRKVIGTYYFWGRRVANWLENNSLAYRILIRIIIVHPTALLAEVALRLTPNIGSTRPKGSCFFSLFSAFSKLILRLRARCK